MRDPGGGTVAEVPVDGMAPSGLFAARPALIRALNEQLLLEHIRVSGPCSRADLARVSGLSKPTVSLALANIERAGLVRLAGQAKGGPRRPSRPRWPTAGGRAWCDCPASERVFPAVPRCCTRSVPRPASCSAW